MPEPAPHRRFEPLACAALALLAYVVLGQRTLYSVDAHGFLMEAERGGVGLHPHHFSYLPLLAASREIGRAVGVPLHTAAVWLSAIGAAVGVGFVHAANVRLLPRCQARLATTLAAATPALVFYATVVEVHGQHFGFCGAAFLATACFARAPSAGAGARLGLAMGLGYLGHATGAMLPAVLLPLAAALAHERGAGGRTLAAGLAAALAGHAAIVIGAPLLLRACGLPAGLGAAENLFAMHLRALAADPLCAADAAWRDWLVPFAPAAWVAVAAVLRPRERTPALALLAGTAVYVLATAALLVPIVDGVVQPGHHTERGAYLLPLAWPIALCAARAVPRPLPLAALGLTAAALAVAGVWAHDTVPQAPFAAGLRALQGERRTFTLVGGHDEIAALLVDLPERKPDTDWQAPVLLLDLPEGAVPAALAAYDAWLRQKVAGGAELWLTHGAIETLGDPGWTKGRPGGPALLQHLRDHFTWTEQHAAGCAAFRLEPGTR